MSARPPTSARGTGRRDSISVTLGDASRRNSISVPRSGRNTQVSVPRSGRGDVSTNATPTRYRTEVSSARRARGDNYDAPVATQANAMKVYIRVRPFSEREMSSKLTMHSTVRIDAENPSVITILEPNRGFRPYSTHIFKRCFWSVFENSSGKNPGQNLSGVRDGVDAYLNGGMNSSRRSRAASMMDPSGGLVSARRRGAAAAAAEADADAANLQGYAGAGSAPVMVDTNVSHPPYASQLEVYQHVGKNVVDNTLEGYNGCIFAYGQTGSGKTFTMLGYAPSKSDIRARRESMATISAANLDELKTEETTQGGTNFDSDDGDDVVDKTGLDPNELQGIIPRTCTDLFEGLRSKRAQDSDFTYRVEVSYYEIYNEKVFDLIRPQKSQDLKIRNSPNSGPYVEGLTWKVVNKEEDVARVIRKGMDERHTAATKFNDRSSRSHAILTFNIVQLSMDESDNAFQMRSKLNLVDLAGSERTGAAGAEGDEFHDGVKINQSLTVLGRVIDRLAELSQNKGGGLKVPYRDSNLTWVLSDSIGGNSQTSMIATISPHAINYDEMRQTIGYASRASSIINWVKKNEDPQVVQMREMRAQIADLQQRLKEAGGSDYTREYVQGLEKKVRQLEKKVAEQEKIIAGLRAQLEFAGIEDPTLAEGYADGAASPAVANKKLEEGFKKQMDKAQITIAELRAELENREKVIDPERLKSLKEKVANQDARLAALTFEVGMYKKMWQRLNDIEAVMAVVEDKETLMLRCCANMLVSSGTESSGLIERMTREREADLEQLKTRHDEELAAHAERARARLKDTLDDSAQQQQQLLDRHKEAIAQLEDRMQRNREIADQERKRHEEERDTMRSKMTEAQQRAREQYQEELEKLRARMEGEADSRQKTNDAVRQLQEMHEKEIGRVNEDMERMQQNKDAEIARLKNQLENERLRRESDMMEKDRQIRIVRNELEDLKREMDKLAAEKDKMEKEYQDQIRDLMVQQEQLIAVSNAVLNDWENKSSGMEADLHKLRALVYDQDYMNFRQKIRNMAFMERENFDQKMQELDEKERLQAARISQIVSKARRAQEDQQRSLRRFEQDMKERIGRTKAAGSKDASLLGSPAPEPIAANGNGHA